MLRTFTPASSAQSHVHANLTVALQDEMTSLRTALRDKYSFHDAVTLYDLITNPNAPDEVLSLMEVVLTERAIEVWLCLVACEF